jgi:hypothetical protein
VRAVCLFAVAGALVLTACGASRETRARPLGFGLRGGNIVGYTVAIEAGGRVSIATGSSVFHRRIPVRRVRQRERELQEAHLATSRVCPGSLPDIATQYIRLGGRTFTLRGACEPRFLHVWSALRSAVGPLPR